MDPNYILLFKPTRIVIHFLYDLFQKIHLCHTMTTISKKIMEKHLKLKIILQLLMDFSEKIGLHINPAMLHQITLKKVIKILFKIYRHVYSKLKQLSHLCTAPKLIENKND